MENLILIIVVILLFGAVFYIGGAYCYLFKHKWVKSCYVTPCGERMHTCKRCKEMESNKETLARVEFEKWEIEKILLSEE